MNIGKTVFWAIVLFLVIGVLFYWVRGLNRQIRLPKNNTGIPEGIVCTMDAKLCPDGSYVGRTGPNCEFSQCPGY